MVNWWLRKPDRDARDWPACRVRIEQGDTASRSLRIASEHQLGESTMRAAFPVGLTLASLLFSATAVSAHDCDAVLSQGIRNTYQELRTSDIRSAFAQSYCSKTSNTTGRTSGTSGPAPPF